MKSKTLLLLAALLSAGATAPVVAANSGASPIHPDLVMELSADTLDYLVSRTRVSVGMGRGTVLDQLGEPSTLLHPDVWAFKSFHASNVFSAERYDVLLVIFKDDRVAKLTLTSRDAICVAAARQQKVTRATGAQ
jgi:hypothetical protein